MMRYCQHGTVSAQTASAGCSDISPIRKFIGCTPQNFTFSNMKHGTDELKGLYNGSQYTN